MVKLEAYQIINLQWQLCKMNKDGSKKEEEIKDKDGETLPIDNWPEPDELLEEPEEDEEDVEEVFDEEEYM